MTDEILKRLEIARDAIRARMAEKNINATGRTSQSLRVEKYDKGIRLISGPAEKIAPFATVQHGSGAGVRGGWFPFVLYEWSLAKGLSFENERDRWTFAFATARKIEEQGTQRFRTPDMEVYTPELEQVVIDVKQIAVAEVKKYLR